MNTIPTIEELDRIGCEASGMIAGQPAGCFQKYLTAVRDAVVAACRPQLRPISEMPAEVPEGCVRLFAGPSTRGLYGFTYDKCLADTHFIDIAPPSDTYPPEFEAAWEQHGKLEPKSAAYALWKGGER